MALVAWPFPESVENHGHAADELAKLVASGTFVEPAEPSFFEARDGARRLYRLYPGSGADLLIFLHGSGGDSRYLARLANALARLPDGPTVATPDMRGHGPEPVRRGDVDHMHQQEQDIADLYAALKRIRHFDRFLLGGHSSGGGMALRYAAGHEQPRPDGLMLVAPFIHRKSPAACPDSGGWATPCVPRFAGIEMLGRFGIRLFENRPVLRFAVPPEARDGNETPLYSWRMYKSMTLSDNWRKEIAGIQAPVLVVAAGKDVIFRSDGYKAVFKNLPRASVEILPGIDHFQLSTSDEALKRMEAWLRENRQN
ncbi:MAG: alpha/beta hydrolase [Zoogloeaceae bacterium]|nr:alpha/beta hydrolase [Zoogloeaceae bacterium]